MITDLTVGKPAKVIGAFFAPMLLSVAFQQLYNIADSVVAGRFIGDNALAAVGASYSITLIYMAMALGANVGAAVVISQLFGAKEYERLKTAISTAVIAVEAFAIILTVIGLITCRGMLYAMQTPEELMADGSVYLNVYIASLFFVFLYNISTGIFTALGDSKTPLYFLIASSVGNVILDIVFVVCFNWGVAGIAWATFTAQGIAAMLAFVVLLLRVKKIKSRKYKKFSWTMLGRISKTAIPSILQQSFVSVGNLFIQSRINYFGADVIAGYAAAIKLNNFTINTFGAFGNAMSSFAAQNFGAGQTGRIIKGTKSAIFMMFAVAMPFFICFFFLPNVMLGFFTNNVAGSKLFEVGTLFLRIISPFYFIVGIKILLDGTMRGMGRMTSFMIATFADLILRVVLAYILSGILDSETGIWLSWPIGWVIGTLISVAFYMLMYRQSMASTAKTDRNISA